MQLIRRRAASIAGFWLACQLAIAGVAPLSLCCNRSSGVAGRHDEACCPGVAPGQVCPMHHTREGGRTCRMVTACGQPDVVLTALASGMGVIPSAAPLSPADVRTEIVRIPSTPIIVGGDRPEAPPPRF